MPVLSFANTQLAIRLESEEFDPREGELLFWFQVKMGEDRYANFALTGDPIKIPRNTSEPIDVRLTLKAKETLWQCLGASEMRTETYGCIDVVKALESVNNNFGLIIFPTSSDPDPHLQPSGKLYIHSFIVEPLEGLVD